MLANEDLTEQTATYFYVGRGTDGSLQTHLCQDELRQAALIDSILQLYNNSAFRRLIILSFVMRCRSSKAYNIVKRVVGHTVPVLAGEMLSLRILVIFHPVKIYVL